MRVKNRRLPIRDATLLRSLLRLSCSLEWSETPLLGHLCQRGELLLDKTLMDAVPNGQPGSEPATNPGREKEFWTVKENPGIPNCILKRNLETLESTNESRNRKTRAGKTGANSGTEKKIPSECI